MRVAGAWDELGIRGPPRVRAYNAATSVDAAAVESHQCDDAVQWQGVNDSMDGGPSFKTWRVSLRET